jgi:hypothetical protein
MDQTVEERLRFGTSERYDGLVDEPTENPDFELEISTGHIEMPTPLAATLGIGPNPSFGIDTTPAERSVADSHHDGAVLREHTGEINQLRAFSVGIEVLKHIEPGMLAVGA